jgi:hypothetical protein
MSSERNPQRQAGSVTGSETGQGEGQAPIVPLMPLPAGLAATGDDNSWGDALATYRLAATDLDDLPSDSDQTEVDDCCAALHEAMWRILELPAPDWGAFVVKLRAATLDSGTLCDGALPAITADAIRLSGQQDAP